MLNFQLLHNCVSCFAGLTAHTSLHFFAMHIRAYHDICYILSDQCAKCSQNTVHVFIRWNIFLCIVYTLQEFCCAMCVCMGGGGTEILLELHQWVIISKLFLIQWTFHIIFIHFIKKKLKLCKFKVLINHTTHITKYFLVWADCLLTLTSIYT
jgi:hypothetical protein